MAEEIPVSGASAFVTISAPVVGVAARTGLPADSTPRTEVEVALPGGRLLIVFTGSYAEAAEKGLFPGCTIDCKGVLGFQQWETQRSGPRERVVVKGAYFTFQRPVVKAAKDVP